MSNQKKRDGMKGCNNNRTLPWHLIWRSLTSNGMFAYFISLQWSFVQIVSCRFSFSSHAHVLTKDLADSTFADGASVVLDTAKYSWIVLLLENVSWIFAFEILNSPFDSLDS